MHCFKGERREGDEGTKRINTEGKSKNWGENVVQCINRKRRKEIEVRKG